MLSLAFVSLTLLAAGAAPAPAAGADTPIPPNDPTFVGSTTPPPTEWGTFDAPPPASKEDTELWWKGKKVTNDVQGLRAAATQVQADAHRMGWKQRLDAAVARKTLSKERAAKIERELREEWDRLAFFLTARWPVDPTRVCGYPFLAFDDALRMADGAKDKVRFLVDARGRLQDCIGGADRVIVELDDRIKDFREELAELEKEAPPLAPARWAPSKKKKEAALPPLNPAAGR